MTEPRRSYLGIPVIGDINSADARAEQYTHEQVAALVKAVIEYPTVQAIGWTAYTPYFNDGEPCTFSICGFWVAVDGDELTRVRDTDDDEWDGHDETSNEDKFDFWEGKERQTVGYRSWDWVRDADTGDSRKVYKPYVGPDETRFNLILALYEAIDDDHCDDVLLSLFGDHCKVTMTREKITVEEYSHD